MELNFTGLGKITSDSLNSGGKYDNPNNDKENIKTSSNCQYEPNTGNADISTAKLNKEKEINAKTSQMHQFYQDNVKNSQLMTAELLKGVKAGEETGALLLKAIKTISMMTGNDLIYSEFEEDFKSVYGFGLMEPYPLKIELEKVVKRLDRLKQAERRQELQENDRQRIKAAIKAHEERIAVINKMLKQTENGVINNA